MKFSRLAFAFLLSLSFVKAYGDEATPNPDKIRFSAYVLVDAFYDFNITNYMHGQQGSGSVGYFQGQDDTLALGIAEIGLSAIQGPAKAHISLIYGTAPYLVAFPPMDLWEGYVAYKPTDWELRAGVLAPFLGFEVLETTENWNQSRSLMYTYSAPRNNLGFSAKVSPVEEFSATFFLLTPPSLPPPHVGKTYGVKLEGKPQPDLTLTLTGEAGPSYLIGGNADPFSSLGGELRVLWKIEEKLSMALSANGVSQDPYGTGRTEVLSVALYGLYRIEPDWSVALRLEEFLDPQASTLLYGPFVPVPVPATMEGREATVTLEHKLTANLRTRLEGRMDWAVGDGANYTVGPFAGNESYQFTATWGAALGF